MAKRIAKSRVSIPPAKDERNPRTGMYPAPKIYRPGQEVELTPEQEQRLDAQGSLVPKEEAAPAKAKSTRSTKAKSTGSEEPVTESDSDESETQEG